MIHQTTETATGKATRRPANRSSKNRKPRMSAEEREARRAADAALIEAAGARLDGDEAGEELVDFITARPALARLSVKNCALLAEQAEMRGTDVSNVQTFKGWQALGRQVKKGAKAYKLTVPRGSDDEAKAKDDEKADKDQDESKERKPRFYLKAGWFDVSQTEGIEDTEPDDE